MPFLFALIQMLGGVSGAHLNPAVTVAATMLKRIDPIDAVVYILAQLSGGVLGALLTKALLVDEGRAGHYGAVQVSPLLGGEFQGGLTKPKRLVDTPRGRGQLDLPAWLPAGLGRVRRA